MKVELIKPIAGLAYFEGDVIDMPHEKAIKYIELGFCVQANTFTFPDDLPAYPETAESKAAPEKAVKTVKPKTKS